MRNFVALANSQRVANPWSRRANTMIRGAATPIAAWVGAKPIMAIATVIRMIIRSEAHFRPL
jgi:hypothetical protein